VVADIERHLGAPLEAPAKVAAGVIGVRGPRPGE